MRLSSTRTHEMTARTLNLPWRSIVNKADPEREREIRNEVEYEFSNGRKFRGNPKTRGPYEPEED